MRTDSVLSHTSAFMKLKWFFVTVVLIFWLALASGKQQGSVISSAINGIIDKHFATLKATYPGRIKIVWFGDETKELEALMTKLMKVRNSNIKIEVESVKLEKFSEEEKFKIKFSSIVFFDTVQRFNDNARKIMWTSDPKIRSQHVVYVPKLTIDDIIETLPDGFEIDQVNFLMNVTVNSIDLVTSYMFTEDACRVQQLKTINRFNSNTSTWGNSIFYPKKYQNIHDCTLKSIQSLYPMNDRLVRMIFTTGLNAKLKWTNTTLFDCEECDLTADQEYVTNVVFDYYTVAYPHAYDIFIYAVPPGEPYTDLERMFMMFDFETWIAITVTLHIGFVATWSLNFVSDQVRRLVVGRGYQSPTLNFVSIFLTGGQVRTPETNFARFLFIIFVMWSLIIRTCHQSMLFELLQADIRKPALRTNDELFKSDFTLHDEIEREYDSIQIDEFFLEMMKSPSTRLIGWFKK